MEFTVNFKTPFVLPPDHYFFVPQVDVNGGEFLWLSAPRPIVAPGTPFPPGFTDLQSWTRDETLEPDWLRIGTDIVGPGIDGTPAPTFNAAFSLTGNHPRARVARAPRNSTLCDGPSGIAATPPVLTADDCQHSAGVCRKPIAGG